MAIPSPELLAQHLSPGNFDEAIGRVALTSLDNEKGIDLTASEASEFRDLTERPAINPVDSLAESRDALRRTVTETAGLSAQERKERLSRALNDYIDLIVLLDHETSPSDELDVVHEGIPTYIPDGFVDLGSNDKVRDPLLRTADREQIWVDKKEILTKYRQTLARALFRDYKELTPDQREIAIADQLAYEIFFTMPAIADVREGLIGLGKDKVRLSEMDEGICRHKALTFQVLAQAAGLEGHLMKGYIDDEKHTANFVRIDGGNWYLYDVTRPDYEVNNEGNKMWRPGRYLIDHPPTEGEISHYMVMAEFDGGAHEYIARNRPDDMYWFIEHPLR